MATTTIMLQADETLLKSAERVAAAHNTTVPTMLASALEAISSLDFDESKLPPLTRQALGIAKGVPNRPYKELLAEALVEKYGL